MSSVQNSARHAQGIESAEAAEALIQQLQLENLCLRSAAAGSSSSEDDAAAGGGGLLARLQREHALREAAEVRHFCGLRAVFACLQYSHACSICMPAWAY